MPDITASNDGSAGGAAARLARLGIVTDIHWDRARDPELAWHNRFDVAGSLERLRQAAASFHLAGCDALVCLGDFTQRGDERSLRDVLGALEADWGGPLVFAPGNHDGAGPPLERVGWQPPPALGLERVTLAETPPFSGTLKPAAAQPPEAYVRLVVSHFPLLSLRTPLEVAGFAYAGDLENRAGLEAALLEAERPTIVLSGHIHARAATIRERVLQLTFGALVEPPYESAVVELGVTDDGTVRVHRHTLQHRATNAQLRVPDLSPPSEQWVFNRNRWAPPLKLAEY